MKHCLYDQKWVIPCIFLVMGNAKITDIMEQCMYPGSMSERFTNAKIVIM